MITSLFVSTEQCEGKETFLFLCTGLFWSSFERAFTNHSRLRNTGAVQLRLSTKEIELTLELFSAQCRKEQSPLQSL